MENNLKNKIVVITGGAGGIGFSCAMAFAKTGATVVIFGRNLAKLKKVKKKLLEFSKCEVFSVDVSNTEKTKQIFNSIYKKYKKVDILLNCAGVYGSIGKFHNNDLKDWKEALSINLIGTINTCHAVLPFMVKAKQGKIVNLSGGGAVQPFPNFSAYATSKAAVVRFSENLAKEYEQNNIQVNTIAPGAVNTLFLERVLKAGPKFAGKEFYEKSLEQKQSGGDSPEAAAELVLFLCSLKSRNISGKLISAKWDPWKKWNKQDLEKIKKSSEFTLRRIDNKYFKQI